MRWGPYRDAGEATARLTAYANAVYVRPVGVLWVCGGQSAWLRRPSYDYAGNGLAMLVRCEIAPPAAVRPTTLQSVQNVLAKAEAFAHSALPGALLVAGVSLESQRWLSENVIAPVDGWLTQHPAVRDGLVVVGDVAGVIAGTAALIGIFTVGGTVAAVAAGIATVAAGVACLVLLTQDAQHFWLTLTGNDAARGRLEQSGTYQWIQAIAPWFTLPDLAIGGVGTFREASAATRFAGRANAVMAARQTRVAGASRELRETLAGGEAGFQDANRVRAALQKQARDLADEGDGASRQQAPSAQAQQRRLHGRRRMGNAAILQRSARSSQAAQQGSDSARAIRRSSEDAHRYRPARRCRSSARAVTPGSRGRADAPVRFDHDLQPERHEAWPIVTATFLRTALL